LNSRQQIDQAFDLIQKGDLLGAKAICFFLGKSDGGNIDAQFLLGVIAYKENRFKDAIDLVSIAIEARPTVGEYHKILGDILLADKRIEEAVSVYRKGYNLDISNIQLGMNLARALRRNGGEGEALEVVKQISNQCGNKTFAATLASWRLSYVASSADHMAEMRRDYECSVNALQTVDGPIDENLLLYTGTNFLAAYQGENDRSFQEVIADFYLRACPTLAYRASHVDQLSRSRVRIGFVSQSFRNHTVGRLYQGLIAQFNKRDWKVYVYASGKMDEVAHHIQTNCYAFRSLPANLQDARDLIAADQLDVLFYADIGMDPLTYFLAFARLAHVQCVGWGHGVTTGIRSLDYFISSKHLETDDTIAAASQYTEKLIRLSSPPTYLYPFDERFHEQEPMKPVAEGQTLYFCSQPLYKVHPDFDPILIDILRRDKNGVAVFIEGHPNWCASLRNRWQAIDINVSKRICFVPKLDKNAFQSMLAMADVILDTIYFTGGISSAEALSLGTPVITYAGTPTMSGRVTYAYYQQVGVLDCIAYTLAEYVDIAVKLGTDKFWRDNVSANLKDRRHLLFECHEVVEELSEFFLSRLDLA